jgi:oligoendopeptidase F
MMAQVRTRKEIPTEHTWDISSIFPTEEAWETEFKSIAAELSSLAKHRGHLGDSAGALADWFEVSEVVQFRLGKLFVYASMNQAVDANDQAAAARFDRARGLMARTGAAMAFAEPEMIKIGFEKLRGWAKEDKRLAIYVHYFDRLEKRAEHVRSAEVEELLSQASDTFNTATLTHGILANAELRFAPAHDRRSPSGDESEITQGTINALLTHGDREVRRTAWENYADAHLALKNTMANVIATGIKRDVFTMRARKYNSSLEASLAPNYIPLPVFHNLIKTFRANVPTWHRYWRIRKRALGYDKLYVYDTRAPLTKKRINVPFGQAVEWISQGMTPLGQDYVGVLRDGVMEQRWVDIYPNKGKRMGAFSTGAPGTHPFIFMSFNEDIFSMSTLAHELGHSMHSYYTRKTQPFVYARNGLFVAETASNFNQALVRRHLLAGNPDPEFQIGVIEEAMSNFHRYFFIMPSLARFELEAHERVERGEALTADSMTALMADLLGEVYGDEVEVDRERSGITWAQFHTHLYSNFYVYQYATGIAGAHALAERVLTGDAQARDNYLAFLNAGGSMYPLDIKMAGVDLSSPEPVEKAFATMAEYVDRLEKLVGK